MYSIWHIPKFSAFVTLTEKSSCKIWTLFDASLWLIISIKLPKIFGGIDIGWILVDRMWRGRDASVWKVTKTQNKWQTREDKGMISGKMWDIDCVHQTDSAADPKRQSTTRAGVAANTLLPRLSFSVNTHQAHASAPIYLTRH